MKDLNDIEIKSGSVVDTHQTVNGQNIFVVLSTEPLDVRYGYDLSYKYQYDVEELLDKNREEKTVEVIGDIYKYLEDVL